MHPRGGAGVGRAINQTRETNTGTDPGIGTVIIKGILTSPKSLGEIIVQVRVQNSIITMGRIKCQDFRQAKEVLDQLFLNSMILHPGKYMWEVLHSIIVMQKSPYSWPKLC